MSQYLKGDQKETVLELIRKYIAYRLDNEEIIQNLKSNGYEISQRTLRRYKLEIRKKSGNNNVEIYENEIADNFIEEIFTLRELQREGWKEYHKTNVLNEKIKVLTLIRNSTIDKLKLLDFIPGGFKSYPTRHDKEMREERRLRMLKN